MSYSALKQEITDVVNLLKRLKEKFKNVYPIIQEANPGDLLEDGTIVIAKYPNAALIAAPESTQVRCKWTKEFNSVFDKLSEEGFNPSQWFIPSVEQLRSAYEVAKQHFSSSLYWSSTEASSTNACFVYFTYGTQASYSKSFSLCVRAFRFVSF